MTLPFETTGTGAPLERPRLMLNPAQSGSEVDVHRTPHSMTSNTLASPLPFPYVSSWIKPGSLCGVHVLDTFEAHQISLDLDNPARNRVQPQQLLQVMSSCTRSAHRAHFPLVLGEHLFFDPTPAAEPFLITSPPLRDALKLADWALHLVPTGYKIELIEHGDGAWLMFNHPHIDHQDNARRYVIECMMAVARRVAGYLLGAPPALLAIHFKHERPPYSEQFFRHFQIEPRFNQARNAIYFNRDILDTPLPGARPDLHQRAHDILVNHSTFHESPVSFAQSVIERVSQQTDLLSCNLNEIAQHFGMSSRTFQRRLKQEGRAFSDLISTAQCALATRWLAETQMDINTISARLGYQSRRAFTNAFKQWTGTTPSGYRERVAKG